MNVVSNASFAFMFAYMLMCSFVAYRVRPRKTGESYPVLPATIISLNLRSRSCCPYSLGVGCSVTRAIHDFRLPSRCQSLYHASPTQSTAAETAPCNPKVRG